MKSQTLVLANQPSKDISLDGPNATFKLQEVDLPELQDGQVLVELLYLSNDPAQRGWIQKDADPARMYHRIVPEGDVMDSGAVAKVLESKSKDHKQGDLVTGQFGWREKAVVKGAEANKIQPIDGVSPSVFLGAFGLPGLTAYFGIVDVLKFQKGQSIVVSGAAGAVGNIVVQYCKHVLGASKVIALAGSDDKCEYLKKIGADVAINYKSKDYKQQLDDATSDYVDCYFDNVGGETLDYMLTRVKKYGTIACCGAISIYNDPKSSKLTNWFEVISNELNIKGYIVISYLNRINEGREALTKAYKEGKLSLEGGETIKKAAFADIPKVWTGLFSGVNQGKLVTELVSGQNKI